MSRVLPDLPLVRAARDLVADYRSLREAARLLECSTRTLAHIMGDCWIRPSSLDRVRIDILLQWGPLASRGQS